MATASKIEWTQITWNPVTGCTKISHGCKHCYAERLAKRLQAMGMPKYRQGFRPVIHEASLAEPSRWKRPSYVFVNSMSDLFHQSIPASFIRAVFSVMNQTPQHVFQVLTKRPGRAAQLSPSLSWTPNIWLGASVESERWLPRIDHLRATEAAVKFLSLEPLIGPLSRLDLNRIGWVIVGGESGPRARPIESRWVREIRDNCLDHDIPFFFKQWGGVFKRKAGRLLDGRTWEQMPQSIPDSARLAAP